MPRGQYERKPRTECRNGHEYVEGSYRIDAKGHHLCLICERENSRRNYNPERAKELRTIRIQSPEGQAARRASRRSARIARQHLKGYGLTEASYQAILDSQDGRCGNPRCDAVVPGGPGDNWHIDHDHSCCPGAYSCGECVCNGCNMSVGHARDSIEVLWGLIDYLTSFKEKREAA